MGRTGHVELYSTGREESSTVVNESAVIQTHQMAGRQARGERAHNKNIDYMETQIRQIIRQTCVAVVKRVVRVSRSEFRGRMWPKSGEVQDIAVVVAVAVAVRIGVAIAVAIILSAHRSERLTTQVSI